VNGDKDRHAQAADAVQDECQHWTFTLVPQTGNQADISFQAHRGLLEWNMELERLPIIAAYTTR
jgi:hypothetical protein